MASCPRCGADASKFYGDPPNMQCHGCDSSPNPVMHTRRSGV